MSLPPNRRTTTLPSHLRTGHTTTTLPATAHPAATTSRSSSAAASASASASSSAAAAAAAHPALAARIADKRRELAHLTELRDLSAQLAAQMAALEAKLGTLASGTEAVATVLANWHSVLQAIQMASAKMPTAVGADGEEGGGGAEAGADGDGGVPLPQTLVRIPVEQASTLGSGGAGE